MRKKDATHQPLKEFEGQPGNLPVLMVRHTVNKPAHPLLAREVMLDISQHLNDLAFLVIRPS